MRIPLASVGPRTCGGCTLCCKVMAVPALDKGPNVWCPHARKGTGCVIYATRPAACEEFRCLWLQKADVLPDAFRPDRIHGVVASTTDGEHLVIREDPGYRGHARGVLAELIERFIADGTRCAVIVCGEERTFKGNPALLEVFQRRDV